MTPTAVPRQRRRLTCLCSNVPRTFCARTSLVVLALVRGRGLARRDTELGQRLVGLGVGINLGDGVDARLLGAPPADGGSEQDEQEYERQASQSDADALHVLDYPPPPPGSTSLCAASINGNHAA